MRGKLIDSLIRVTVDWEGCTVMVLFSFIYLTFYKPHQNRLPIVTFFRFTR